MSTEENSKNNIETIFTNSNNINTIKLNEESIKEPYQIKSYEQKIKDLKKNLQNLLKRTLGKTLLNLETNNQTQLQLLNLTTKSYKEFDNKINIMKKQVEENIKKKEENKKIKKIKVSKAKFRSRTSQKNNPKLKEFNKTLPNESNKSLIKIRAKTEKKNDIRIPNSEKKPLKNKNISIKVEKNNDLNNTIKLNKSNSNKFNINLTEHSNNKTKKKINNEININMNNKLSSSNIKQRKNSKEIKNSLRNNNSKNKINVIQKSQNDLKSNSKLLSDTKEKTTKESNNSKKLLINRKNMNLDYRKSFDYSNRKIPKSKINTNYIKKNTEILTEKKSASKKNILKNNSKNKIIKDNQTEIKKETEDDIDKKFEEKKAILEKMRKQREEINIREEEKKKEFEKVKEEAEKFEEERKRKELEKKQKEEERKKQIEEEEKKKDEERRKKQMEIEAQIQQEKIEQENYKKELELEKQRQKELERKKKLEEEERIKKVELEKLELEMDKIKEEKIEELPVNIELNIEKKSNDDYFYEENKKNKDMNIQDLLELEEKNDQIFEYFHIKEEDEIKKDTPQIEQEQNKNLIKNNNIIENDTPVIVYRQISILELIHDAEKFSPILFEFLSFKDLLEFTSISKKIKRQRIYFFNSQKQTILNNIGFQNEESLNQKIKEYEENYAKDELNEPFVEYHLSKGTSRALQVLNNNNYSKIFRRPVLDNNLSPIYIAYKILLIFLGEINIAKITDDKLFWVKCTEYLNSKSDNGKIGDFIMSKFDKYNCDGKIVYYIEQIMKGKKDNISPSYFSKLCGSTGLLIFLIKELLEYCGVIISTKKTQLSRIYQNLIFFRNIIDKLSEFNQTLENFNQ